MVWTLYFALLYAVYSPARYVGSLHLLLYLFLLRAISIPWKYATIIITTAQCRDEMRKKSIFSLLSLLSSKRWRIICALYSSGHRVKLGNSDFSEHYSVLPRKLSNWIRSRDLREVWRKDARKEFKHSRKNC